MREEIVLISHDDIRSLINKFPEFSVNEPLRNRHARTLQCAPARRKLTRATELEKWTRLAFELKDDEVGNVDRGLSGEGEWTAQYWVESAIWNLQESVILNEIPDTAAAQAIANQIEAFISHRADYELPPVTPRHSRSRTRSSSRPRSTRAASPPRARSGSGSRSPKRRRTTETEQRALGTAPRMGYRQALRYGKTTAYLRAEWGFAA
ncbi:hypothetical protein JCM10207_000889 [Rhodosporidiobolus poonsookiae]